MPHTVAEVVLTICGCCLGVSSSTLERVSGAVFYGSDMSLQSDMHANRKFTVHQEMLRLPREGEVVALGKWVDSHVEADGVSTVLAVSRLIRVLILREAVRAPDTNIAADICLAAKMAQESH